MNKRCIVLLLLVVACNPEKRQERKTRSITPPAVAEGIADKPATGTINWRNGDVIFIRSASRLSDPISQATHSEYTHCAVYWNLPGKGDMVIEAYDTSRIRPLDEFINDAADTRLLVMRLQKPGDFFSNETQEKFITRSKKQLGLPYDGKFMWGDDAMYCSELVYKLYENVGIKLCRLKTIGDFDLGSPQVKKELQLRYDGKVPLNEKVVAPVDLIYSPLLDTVFIQP